VKEAILKMPAGLLGSKKFGVFVVGLVVTLLCRLGLEEAIAKEVSQLVFGLAVAALGSYAAEDLGKGKAKVENGK
jgi:hypothetical protein